MRSKRGEVRDVPFFKNDMNDSVPTMGRPIDTADGPGKADSEMGIAADEPHPKVAVDPLDALIDEPRDHVFQDQP